MHTAVESPVLQSVELDSCSLIHESGSLPPGSQIDLLSSVPDIALPSSGSESISRSSSNSPPRKKSRASTAMGGVVHEDDFNEEEEEAEELEEEEEDEEKEEEEEEYEYVVTVVKEIKMMTLYDSEFEDQSLEDIDDLCEELLQNQPYRDVSNLPPPTPEIYDDHDKKFRENLGFDMPRYEMKSHLLIQPANTSREHLDSLVLCAKAAVKHENKRRQQCNEEQGINLSELKLTGIVKAMSQETNLRNYWFTIRVEEIEDDNPVEKIYEATVKLMSPITETFFQFFRVKGSAGNYGDPVIQAVEASQNSESDSETEVEPTEDSDSETDEPSEDLEPEAVEPSRDDFVNIYDRDDVPIFILMMELLKCNTGTDMDKDEEPSNKEYDNQVGGCGEVDVAVYHNVINLRKQSHEVFDACITDAVLYSRAAVNLENKKRNERNQKKRAAGGVELEKKLKLLRVVKAMYSGDLPSSYLLTLEVEEMELSSGEDKENSALGDTKTYETLVKNNTPVTRDDFVFFREKGSLSSFKRGEGISQSPQYRGGRVRVSSWLK